MHLPQRSSTYIGTYRKTHLQNLSAIRDCYGLKSNQYVSISLFADYTGLPEEEIRKLLL